MSEEYKSNTQNHPSREFCGSLAGYGALAFEVQTCSS